jgi:hypothetical protein
MYGITIDVMSSVCDRLAKTNEVLLYLQFVMEDRSFSLNETADFRISQFWHFLISNIQYIDRNRNIYISYMPTLPIYAVVYRIFKSSTAYRF